MMRTPCRPLACSRTAEDQSCHSIVGARPPVTGSHGARPGPLDCATTRARLTRSFGNDRAGGPHETDELMRERLESIARTLTDAQGKPLPESRAEINHSADTFEWFAEEGKRAYGQVIPHSQPGKRHVTLKHPVGVVAAVSPWNFPITLQSRKIAPALAAGCTIVCKPASGTPLCLVQVFECMVEAGLPAGVANLVIGPAQEMADEFLENPAVRKISFTGSTEVGKQLMKGAADQMKRISLELGGHAPFIVFPDADPEVGAKIAVMGKFR